ncbi:hypothetical protein BDF20DRAFT_804656, partial [Mycotypha africana]|uniref:uncharacterized protein n=1 Tax=Mycotypha africana TaxID=64632 RepID=UPI0022FFC635
THAFANLFRSSRLASYDRTINQVYTTTKNFKKIGDWGLKRNLPTVIRTDYTTIKDLDTAEHQTPWYTANNQVLFMKRWKENFDASVSQKPKTPAASVTEDNDKQLQNVMAMTPAQFNHFKKQCAKRASEFQHLVKSKQLVREQIYDYLNVTFEQERPVMGPTYSAATPPQEPLKVQGRILNPVKVDYFIGHAVAVGGIVALLPREYASFIQANKNDRNQLHDFYVESITMNEDGTPLIILN